MSSKTIDELAPKDLGVELKNDDISNPVDPCPKCGVERDPKFPMCKACGFYETLNTYVEIDQIDLENGVVPEEKPFVFPLWGKILIVIAVLVVAESLVPIMIYPINSYQRTMWSLIQLGIGLVAALVSHGRATFITVMENSDAEIGDSIMRPGRVWMPMCADLPKTLPWVGSFLAGTLAVILSLVVIRSIPYEKMFESDHPTKPAVNPVIGMVAKAAQAMPQKEMTMDEAMKQFDDLAVGNMQGVNPDDAPKTREALECLVIGYYESDDAEQNLSSLLVAGVIDHKLKVIGSVRVGIDDKMLSFLERQLPSIPRERPFIDSNKRANWVEPYLLVNVSFIQYGPGDFRELKFLGLAGTTTPEEQAEKREDRRQLRKEEREKEEAKESALDDEENLFGGQSFGPLDSLGPDFDSGLESLSF